mgnify:CR=1 FL=1
MLDRLKAPKGANQKKTRRGRGEGSGLGKPSGRGGKGQTARSGGNIKPGFEGGQMPLQRRVPKLRGFNNPFRVAYQGINLDVLEECGLDEISPESLHAKGLVHKGALVKILGRGELTRSVRVAAHGFSKTAEAAITTTTT